MRFPLERWGGVVCLIRVAGIEYNKTDLPPAEAVALERRIARRVNLGVYLTSAAAPVAGALIAFSLAYLFAQMLAPQLTRFSWFVLLLVPAALVWAWRKCQRQLLFFQSIDVVSLMDKLGSADGLAATAWERPGLSAGGRVWPTLSGRINTRPLRLSPVFFGWRLLPAFAFAGLVLLVPPRKPAAKADVNIMAGLTEPLQEKLSMSAEIIPEAEREKIQEQLDQLNTADPTVTREKWEAMEDVQKTLENALSQSDAAAQQLTKSLAQMAELASQKGSATGAAEATEMQSQMETLAKSVEDIMKAGTAPMDKQMKDQLAKAMGQCKSGNCSAGDLEKLRQRAEALRNAISKKLGPQKSGNSVGSGGVERGRADAALDFGEEHTLENAKFDPKQLENQYFDESSLTDLGITVVEPKAEPGVFKPGTVKQFTGQAGSNVSRTEIGPAQRGVVSRYFQ